MISAIATTSTIEPPKPPTSSANGRPQEAHLGDVRPDLA